MSGNHQIPDARHSGSSSCIPPIGFARNSYVSTGAADARSSVVNERERHAIHVLFLQPLPNDPHEHFLNKLTSFIGASVHNKGFHHTEIVIPDLDAGDGGFLSSSIYNGECVTLTKTKTFANPGG